MATTGGSLPSSTPTFVLLSPSLVELLLALVDESIALPSDLLASLASVVPPAPLIASLEGDSTSIPRAPEISYGLVRKVGNWCTSPEGRELLKTNGLDPSSYHPHHLLSLTRTTLPQGLRVPPVSSTKNPVSSEPSPYLPSSSVPKLEKSVGQEMSLGVGREMSAILNVAFSAGGVAGGVWWLGRRSYTGWSVEKTTLLALLAFFFIIAVEATLYAIYFQKLNKHRDSEAKAKAKWMAGGLTFVPEEDKPEMIPLDRLLELEEAKSEEKSDGVVVIEVSEAPKGQGKSGREKGKREGLRKREGKAKD